MELDSDQSDSEHEQSNHIHDVIIYQEQDGIGGHLVSQLDAQAWSRANETFKARGGGLLS